MDESQVGKLKQQVTQLEEERSELRNDFYIKFNSFSQEISGLKDKLGKYEPEIKKDLPSLEQEPKPKPNIENQD